MGRLEQCEIASAGADEMSWLAAGLKGLLSTRETQPLTCFSTSAALPVFRCACSDPRAGGRPETLKTIPLLYLLVGGRLALPPRQQPAKGDGKPSPYIVLLRT